MNAPARIGRYEIVRRLGKSMTDVYLAIDTVENRKVALKLIPIGGDAASQQVLEAERRGAAIQKELRALDPRMVEIYEFGEQDGFFFVAMQYVEGKNLAEVLRAEQAMDAVRAATIALEILEHLVKFHTWEQAVVHGDIKPSNIHLGHHDTVRLLDFGIAKTLRVDRDDTTHHFGSPGYCSPERLMRSAVDPQSDLWAVGATLYEMLAGVPPYQAESTRKLERLIRSKRAPRALPSRCPRAAAGDREQSAGAESGPAVRLGARVSGRLAGFPGAQANHGGDGAAHEVESQLHHGGGARLPQAGHPDGGDGEGQGEGCEPRERAGVVWLGHGVVDRRRLDVAVVACAPRSSGLHAGGAGSKPAPIFAQD